MSSESSAHLRMLPAPVSFTEGNVADNWRLFKQQMEFFFNAVISGKTADKKKIGMLMTALGANGIQILNTFDNIDDKSSYEEVIEAFDDYCNPRKNTVYERYVFSQITQGSRTVHAFIVDLKNQARRCEFNVHEFDNLVRDRLVVGIADGKLRKELLRDPDLTLETAATLAKVWEKSDMEDLEISKTVTAKPAIEINRLNPSVRDNRGKISERSTTGRSKCSDCGYEHRTDSCPATGRECNYCHKTGHFASMCRKKPSSPKVAAVDVTSGASAQPSAPTPTSAPAEASISDAAKSIEVLQLYAVSRGHGGVAWYVTLDMQQTRVNFKVDSGAECNTLLVRDYERLCPRPILQPASSALRPYGNGALIIPRGEVIVSVRYRESALPVKFFVVDLPVTGSADNILGLPTIEILGLVQRTFILAPIPQTSEEQNHCNYGFESLPESVVNPATSDDHIFNVFLRDHIETAFTKGFDDNSGRHMSPNLFEIPNARVWFDAANKLFDFFVLSNDNDEASELLNLKSYLDVDQRFSEARCNKVFPLAVATYQENLPSHYTKKYHETKLEHALSVFGIHARGPQMDNYIQKLMKECDKYWKNGRQMCEVLSLTGNLCNLLQHKAPTGEIVSSESTENINVTDLPVMEHSSGVRYISACNCGRKQGPRDDPFTVRVANHDFYQLLGDECGCSHYDRIQFPIFQPSTKDFRAAQLFSKPKKIVGRKDNLNTLLPSKEFGQGTQHGPTQGLSIGFLSSHSVSVVSDVLIVEEQTELQPQEPIPDLNNQLIKPSEGSLTQTSEKIVIHVTDHSDSSKDKGLVRQPSTTEYLPGMLHSESPLGLLPQFASWSLVCLGPSSLYSHNLGLQDQHHPGFLAGSSYLLPWDVTVRLENHVKERFWSSNENRNKNTNQRNRKKGTKEFSVKIFVGVEYECPCGHRFMCSSPDKILKATGSGLVRDNGSKVTNCDMPLYFPCPCRNSKPLIAQLMRIHVVTPKAPVNVTLNPRVQPAPSPCPVFITGTQEPVRLSQSSYWILRLPYVYYGDRGAYLPPKEHLPKYGRLLNGLYGISEVPLDSK